MGWCRGITSRIWQLKTAERVLFANSINKVFLENVLYNVKDQVRIFVNLELKISVLPFKQFLREYFDWFCIIKNITNLLCVSYISTVRIFGKSLLK